MIAENVAYVLITIRTPFGTTEHTSQRLRRSEAEAIQDFVAIARRLADEIDTTIEEAGP